MNNREICPICEQGYLSEESRLVPFNFYGMVSNVSQHIHACNVCGTEIATVDDIKMNSRNARGAENAMSGRLSGQAIRVLRKSLHLTQEAAGRIFGGGPVAFCKYEKDDLTPSDAMDNLLWIVEKFPFLASYLAKRRGIELNIRVDAGVEELRVKAFSMNSAQERELTAKVSNAIAKSHRVWSHGSPMITAPVQASNEFSFAYANAS